MKMKKTKQNKIKQNKKQTGREIIYANIGIVRTPKAWPRCILVHVFILWEKGITIIYLFIYFFIF